MRRFSAIVLLITGLALACGTDRPLRLATTTSVDSSGLLEPLLREFEATSGVAVDALAVGSGKAMQLLRRGDADLMITHDPAGERGFIDDVSPRIYRKLMCSRFIISGPSDDPARVSEAASAVDAMERIATSGKAFSSRGDRSGTHVRELELWRLAETAPDSDVLVESGQGMAATLRIASERNAYVLTDEATFAHMRKSLDLEPLYSRDDPALLNCYAVTVSSGPNEEEALRLAEWLTRGEGRTIIGAFEIGGKQPFRVWPSGVPDHEPEFLPE
ncbi:MAG: substrate-binding domain-containing protein [Thermoanaerobaculia bacterium]|nr:substrate-binding domain-containing protein [Thermoanaerobaculia bacterium]